MAKKMSGVVREALRKSLKYSLSQFLRQLLSDLDVRGAVGKPLKARALGGLGKYLALSKYSKLVEAARLSRNLTKTELRSEILAELLRRKAQTAKAREMLALKRKNPALYEAMKATGGMVAVCPDTRHLVPPTSEAANAPQTEVPAVSSQSETNVPQVPDGGTRQ